MHLWAKGWKILEVLFNPLFNYRLRVFCDLNWLAHAVINFCLTRYTNRIATVIIVKMCVVLIHSLVCGLLQMVARSDLLSGNCAAQYS